MKEAEELTKQQKREAEEQERFQKELAFILRTEIDQDLNDLSEETIKNSGNVQETRGISFL